MLEASTGVQASHHGRLATLHLAPNLALQARTQSISPTGSTSPVAAPLLRGEPAISVGTCRDGEHDSTSQQRVDCTTSPVQPEGGMRAAVQGGVLHPPEYPPEHPSRESSGASVVKTAGSRVRPSLSYAPPQENAIDSDGLIRTGSGPAVFFPLPRSKRPARSKVPAAVEKEIGDAPGSLAVPLR